jgi:hypothetical protein
MKTLIKNGVWMFSSKTDPRWDCDGKGFVSFGSICGKAQDKLQKLKKKYGEPPKDLEYTFEKD